MKLVDVGFSYKKDVVLDNISTTFGRGKIYGLMGHNGAGKTTLLRLCLGLLTPKSGIIENDFDSLAYMPEKGGLCENLTAKQNIEIAAKLYAIKKINVDGILTEWHMVNNANTLAKNLSTGLRKRLGFIIADITSPQALFLDEPTSGMDVASSELFKKHILKLKEQNKCIVFISHNIDLVSEICDRVVIIDNHSIALDSTIKEIDNFKSTYLKYTNEEV